MPPDQNLPEGTVKWSEDWLLGADTEPTNTSTLALRGRELAPGEHVQVVDRAEAERKCEQVREQERQRMREALKGLPEFLAEVESDFGRVSTVQRGTTLALRSEDIASARAIVEALFDSPKKKDPDDVSW